MAFQTDRQTSSSGFIFNPQQSFVPTQSTIFGPGTTTSTGETMVRTQTPANIDRIPEADETFSPSDNITSSRDVAGANIRTTESGDTLGLEDLKNTQAFQDFAAQNPGATGQDYLSALDETESLFKESRQFLNRQEEALRASRPELLGLAAAPFEQAVPQLQQATEEGRQRFERGIGETRQEEQTLLANARRLAGELAKRTQQRFGGVELSSAAQAASELGGRELQRQLGGIRQNTAAAVRSIRDNLVNFENQAQAKMQELDMRKAEALQRAELDFRDRLAAIDAQRAQLGQNKAVAKLDLLREFRDRAANIQAQATQFAQQIQLLREQARITANSRLQEFETAGENIGTFVQDTLGGLRDTAQPTQQAITGASALTQVNPLTGLVSGLLGANEEEGLLNNPFRQAQ